MLHALVRARDEDGQPLSEDEMVANLRLLFLAGHETTATTMTFALAHLAERPDLVRRLMDEVRAAGAPPLSLADTRKLPLCEGVFREAARLYGPGWFLARKPTEDLELRGVRIPAGTRIALCPLLWARDPEVYPDPDRFEPDRWIGKQSAPTPYELAQFGGGPHFCLGYHMTWLESVQYLAVLVTILSERRQRLRLAAARMPKIAYFPIMRPSPAAHVIIERA
jgi:cytochrome P450